ncbi:E3 ubiquitin-protein ligase TRIM71, partial [Stylophora pistillata]
FLSAILKKLAQNKPWRRNNQMSEMPSCKQSAKLDVETVTRKAPNCETAACQSCVFIDRAGHAMAHLEEEAEKQKLEMKSLIETHRLDLQAKINTMNRLNEDCAKLIQQSEYIKREVQTFVDNLTATIEAKKQNIFTAVDEETKRFLEALTTQKTETESEIKIIEESLEKAETILRRSTNVDVLQGKKSLEKIFQGADESQSKDCYLEKLPTLTFADNPKLRNTDAKGRRCYNEHDHVTVGIMDEQGRDCATDLRIIDNKGGRYQVSYSPRNIGRCKLTTKVNGEHVRGSQFFVLVKPFQFRPVLSFGEEGSSLGKFKKPWGVAVNARDEFAVTDYENYRVQIFSSEGKFLRSFGKKGHKAGELDHPRGIAFHNNSNICVVEGSNHRIQIFSEEGDYVGSFDGKGNLDSQLNNSCGLSVDSDGNIIVADAYNKPIKIFAPDGKFQRKIGGQGTFTFPFNCIQCDKSFIVSNSNEYCIKDFDRNGNFQYKFGKRGAGDREFESPRCLLVNNSGQLLVCESLNHRIQVFELNGKFVETNATSFKKASDELEEIKNKIEEIYNTREKPRAKRLMRTDEENNVGEQELFDRTVNSITPILGFHPRDQYLSNG